MGSKSSSMNCSVISLSRSSRFCCSVFSARLDLSVLSMSLILARRYFCSSRSFFCESCSRSNSFCSLLLPSKTMLRRPLRCSLARRWMLAASSRFSSRVMGWDSLSSRARAGFFFFFWDLGGAGGLGAVWRGLVSPEMRQQYFSNSLVILMKSSLGALKRQLLWKILTTSWWNCCAEEQRPPFSLPSIVRRSIGSFTISRYSGMSSPSTSTGSMNGSAHLCCCSSCSVFRHGFTASAIPSGFTTAFFPAGALTAGRLWLLAAGLGLNSAAAARSSSSGVFFLAGGFCSFLRWSGWKEQPFGSRAVSACISSADSSTRNTSAGTNSAGSEGFG